MNAPGMFVCVRPARAPLSAENTDAARALSVTLHSRLRWVNNLTGAVVYTYADGTMRRGKGARP